MFSIVSIADGKGGVHMKGCKVHSFYGFKSNNQNTAGTTETTTQHVWKNKHESTKPTNWPWWLAY
jgi:hypothetical protein